MKNKLLLLGLLFLSLGINPAHAAPSYESDLLDKAEANEAFSELMADRALVIQRSQSPEQALAYVRKAELLARTIQAIETDDPRSGFGLDYEALEEKIAELRANGSPVAMAQLNAIREHLQSILVELGNGSQYYANLRRTAEDLNATSFAAISAGERRDVMGTAVTTLLMLAQMAKASVYDVPFEVVPLRKSVANIEGLVFTLNGFAQLPTSVNTSGHDVKRGNLSVSDAGAAGDISVASVS